jgi:sigma-B regulation protein RsbU (phosphoserine phosphatase)
LEIQNLAEFQVQLAYIVLGTVFLFFGFASCAIAAIRRRSEIRVLIWLGLWSGMYGASLLFRTEEVGKAFPSWLQTCFPVTFNAISYLIIVVALLTWSELTRGKMQRLSRAMAAVGLAIAAGGIGLFVATGSSRVFLPLNNLLAVCALISLASVVIVPSLSAQFMILPNRILTISTVIFSADALYRNASRWLLLPSFGLPLVVDDLAFVAFLLSFAYVAGGKVFANERRLLSIESELEIARQIQASSLPTGTPEVQDLQIAAQYLSMTAVGGDFYQFLQADRHHIGILVADVSGHGVPAALIASMMKVAMQSITSFAGRPSEVLRGLNRILFGQLQGQFITAAYLWLDMKARQGLYSAAGHPPLLRWRRGALEAIESNGLLFGVLPDPAYPVRELTLEPGDRFLLYTDGVVEPENAAGDSFGDGALEQVLRDNQERPPAELLERMLAAIHCWQPASAAQLDDITLIVVDVTQEDSVHIEAGQGLEISPAANAAETIQESVAKAGFCRVQASART